MNALLSLLTPQVIQQVAGVVVGKVVDSVTETDDFGEKKLSKKQAAKSTAKTSFLGVMLAAAFQYGASTGAISQEAANCAPALIEEGVEAAQEFIDEQKSEVATEPAPSK